ncbi:MAG: isoleucyl-tRNA synthetase [Bacteroidetes bacterium]|jgi:isoleucyl-tRNA synthetase|nr:isoleucyl-tRNA synthetase [Bacteroidota bacterium]
MKKYPEYKQLNLPQISKDMLKFWEENSTFAKSVSSREGKTPWVFYEGPPSANGMPGIHHVMARAIKDIFCRFKTLQGYQVKRKAGWDTHGLPIELGVEKTLGITKEDIGNKNSPKYISVEDYNKACRKEVMKYTDKWEDVTAQMGYWVDMSDPYITYDNKYIESVWWLLQNLYKKNLLYKGYTIQPFSPAAGTGLSSAELNQPGCYRDVKDRTAVVQFKVSEASKVRIQSSKDDIYFLAWTTTPWTLPSNTALAVGKDIEYVFVNSFNPFNGKPQTVILAKELLNKYFSEKHTDLKFEDYKPGDKNIPFKIVGHCKGSDLAGISYEQLLPFVKPEGEAFKVLVGDFVTTTDGTGIVHIAPSFGADDFKVAKQNEVGSLTLVDRRGKFLPEVQDGVFLYGEEYVKEAYLSEEEKATEYAKQKKILEANGKIKDLKVYLSVDERIVLKLQEEGKLFKKETYEHSYPHCWRTDKPVLYYPLDSWFVKVADNRERLFNLNKEINWKPESTGTGRFGNWLENALDWNLSRSRFWGVPLPIWRSEDGAEQICIGSVEELQKEIENAIAKGMMKENPLSKFKAGDMSKENYDTFDLHKPYADSIFLEKNGKKLVRDSDLIDVWFDSGSMPYAQVHYPFENKELIDNKKYFPADFIAEGVDQTRGWFYTLHVIGALCFDSVAYKNVVSNGLVLDKNGNKMSKRLGNAVDPFFTLNKYGADATRWYMIANAAPWDNLKFSWTNIYEDENGKRIEGTEKIPAEILSKYKIVDGHSDGIEEVQRKLFGTLYNTYGFYALYANVDGFLIDEKNIVPVKERQELDRWILSKLHSLIKEVTEQYENFEPHRAARAIEEFVDEHLSNWYVRLSRRRFWKGDMSTDKKAAYETLHECLTVVAQLMSPISPFFGEWLYQNLTNPIRENAIKNNTPLQYESIHLTNFVKAEAAVIDVNLEQRMELAQKISSMILSIRRKENLKVRQPLQKIQIPILDKEIQTKIEAVKNLILAEVNVKEIEFVDESQTQIIKNMKLNFKTLGKKCGANMKAVQSFANENSAAIIKGIESYGQFTVPVNGAEIVLETEDVEIIPVDIPGWKVANNGPLTVALDVTLTEALRQEGLAREVVNRIQNIRKDKGFEVTDKILVKIQQNANLDTAIKNNLSYICSETLTGDLQLVQELSASNASTIEVDELITTLISIEKLN